jgi:hypothetical protein
MNKVVLSEENLKKAIALYKKHFISDFVCAICGKVTNLKFDELAEETFCEPCLDKSLRNDQNAMLEALEDSGEDDA